MEKGLEGVVNTPQKVYFPDTNVLVLQPLAPYILASDWDSVRDSSYGGRDVIARAEAKGDLSTKPNDLIISSFVETELNNIMHDPKKEEFKAAAAQARTVLYEIRKRGLQGLNEYTSVAELQNGAKVYFVRHNEQEFIKEYPRTEDPDDVLVWTFERWARSNRESGYNLKFVSQDIQCRSKIRDAITRVYLNDTNQLERTANCEEEFDFANPSDDPHHRYRGVIQMKAKTAEELEAFKAGFALDPKEERPWQLRTAELNPNQFLEMHYEGERAALVVGQGKLSAEGLVHYEGLLEHVKSGAKPPEPIVDDEEPQAVTLADVSALIEKTGGKIRGKKLSRLKKRAREDPERVYRELRGQQQRQYIPAQKRIIDVPFNMELTPVYEQIYALEALCNPEVRAVTIVGPQGSGKTLWTFYAAMALINRESYTGLTYFRTHRGMNKGDGALPGSERAKLDPWVKPAIDAMMEVLGGNDGNTQLERRCQEEIKSLEARGIVKFGVDQSVQGNTWRGKRFVIIDEAQNHKHEEIKLLCGRPGEDTKLVLLGDPDQLGAMEQAAHWFLNKRNNGMSHVIANYQGEELYAHVTLSKNTIRRSRLARLAEKL